MPRNRALFLLAWEGEDWRIADKICGQPSVQLVRAGVIVLGGHCPVLAG